LGYTAIDPPHTPAFSQRRLQAINRICRNERLPVLRWGGQPVSHWERQFAEFLMKFPTKVAAKFSTKVPTKVGMTAPRKGTPVEGVPTLASASRRRRRAHLKAVFGAIDEQGEFRCLCLVVFLLGSTKPGGV